jgi:hypothetical protein
MRPNNFILIIFLVSLCLRLCPLQSFDKKITINQASVISFFNNVSPKHNTMVLLIRVHSLPATTMEAKKNKKSSQPCQLYFNDDDSHNMNEKNSSNKAPKIVATTLAWSDRSAPLPKPGSLLQVEHAQRISKVSDRIIQQRVGNAISMGDSTSATRLDRVGNLEILIRSRLLEKFEGNYVRARHHLVQCLVSPNSPSSISADSQRQQPSSTSQNRSTVETQTTAKSASRGGVNQFNRELLVFTDLMKKLSGRQWKTTAHISDIEFMFNNVLKRDMSRFVHRLFPDDLMLAMNSNTIKRSSRMEVSQQLEEAVHLRQVDVVSGPFNSLMIAKSRAISGVKSDNDDGKDSQNEVFQSEARHDAISSSLNENEEDQLKYPSQQVTMSQRPNQQPSEHFLVRYRHSNSLIAVPSWWRKKGNMEYLAQRSSSKPPSVTIEPLHVWCGAGRVDGRAIPIVTQVLQTSIYSREQV